MRDSDFSSIDDYQNKENTQGMGSGDGIDFFSGGNTDDPVIGFGNDSYRQISDNQLRNFLAHGRGSVNDYSSLNALNNFSGGAGDFGIDGSRMGLNTALANLYTKERGASNINPFPEGPFGTDTIFGKVDRTRDLGSRRIQEINDLRARQAFGLPSLKTGKAYTGRDYYPGQETIYGTAAPLPMGGLESLVTSLPGINTVKSLFGGGQNLPPNHPEMIRLRAQAEAEANEPGIIDEIGEGLSSFGTDVYNSLSETGGAIGDFLTNIITKSNSYMDNKFSGSNLNSGAFSGKPQGPPQFKEFSRVPARTVTRDGLGVESVLGQLDYPGSKNDTDFNKTVVAGTNLSPEQYNRPSPDERIGIDLGDAFSSEVLPSDYSPAGVGIAQLGSMNSDGQYGDAAGSLFKRKSLDNYTSSNFTDKAIKDKYNEDFGIQTPTRVETSIPQTNTSVYPKGTRSSDLDAAAATYLSLLQNRDSKMEMDFPTFYSQFKK